MDERDPNCVAKAVAIIALERHPPTEGPTCCVDAKTGIGVRAPAAPSQPVAPGRPARREFEYVRQGTADLLAAFDVRTGRVYGIVRERQRASAFIALLTLLAQQTPRGQLLHLILAPLRRHCAAAGAVYVDYRPGRFAFHWLPKHASGRSFSEAWFAMLSTKGLKRRELAAFAAAAQAITAFMATYKAHQAHPFPWRKGIRFDQRLKDKRAEAHAAGAPAAEAA